MTPGNIVGMAVVKNLDVIALTDHNSCKNCPPFVKYAENFGIIAFPGMELCTMEEVHVICLFPNLEDAMNFDAYVYTRLRQILNQESIFGNQQICNEEDEVIGSEPNLLIHATKIPFNEVFDLVTKYNGIMLPAHIDRPANSILSNLGFVPPDAKFRCAEVKNMNNLHEIRRTNPYFNSCNIITNSDAHYLQDINEPINYLYCKSKTRKDIWDAISNQV